MRVNLLQANALQIPLADQSIHCVITSPPYYGLRDYSVSGQLGLEPTLQEYIENTIKWCAEVWRVLRDDGTFFLNLGDSYNGSGGPGSQYDNKHASGLKGDFKKYDNPNKKQPGFKPKDLMLVPHRVAIALQEWGWWVRSDIIWHKPNPMPESVTDRPTKAHEYIFLLTKNKKYYYDADAIRETTKPESFERMNRGVSANHKNLEIIAVPPGSNIHTLHKKRAHGEGYYLNPAGRNKRTVWTITTRAYKGAHFATFPPEIPEICIKAGTSEKGVCPMCGNQWERELSDATGGAIGKAWLDHKHDAEKGNFKTISSKGYKPGETTGWKPTCSHDEEPVPATVLDPFGGSGTTAMVANQLGRHGISLDLSWEYLQLAKKRTGITGLQEWENGRKEESNLEGLPMFEDVT